MQNARRASGLCENFYRSKTQYNDETRSAKRRNRAFYHAKDMQRNRLRTDMELMVRVVQTVGKRDGDWQKDCLKRATACAMVLRKVIRSAQRPRPDQGMELGGWFPPTTGWASKLPAGIWRGMSNASFIRQSGA